MDFKKLLFIAGLTLCMGLVGCTYRPLGDDSSDNFFGNRVTEVAPLTTPDEGQSQNLVLFDKSVRRIHQFDLTEMKHVRSFGVKNPDIPHYVLYGNNGNYIVDLSEKGLSIFNRYDQAIHNPIKLQGKPLSAAFLPSKGLLIVYDELMTVGMLKINNNGDVEKSWRGGAAITNGQTIAAGDLNESGQAILALSDGTVVVVNPEASMDAQDWVKTTAAPIVTGLTNIKWLAPVPKKPNQVFIRASNKLALLDISSETILSSYDLTDEVTKLSKFNDPHVIMQNSNQIKVAYVANSQIEVKTFYLHPGKFEMNYLMSSHLDLAKNTWSFVDTKDPVNYFFNDLDVAKKNRRFVRYDFAQELATHQMPVPNDTQVEMAEDFIFALFPHKMGYAVRIDVSDEQRSELAQFNLKFIPAD